MCMERIGTSLNSFAWPDNDDIGCYSIDQVVFDINSPNLEIG